MSATFKDDTHVQWVFSRFSLFFRNLSSDDATKLRAVVNEYFPSVDSYKRHEGEVLELLRSNLTPSQRKLLERAEEIAVGNTTPDEEDRTIKREANRLKNHMRFLYKKIQDIVYGETVSATPSRDSSRSSVKENAEHEETITMAAYEMMRNNYEVKIRELEYKVHTSSQKQESPTDDLLRDMENLNLNLFNDDPLMNLLSRTIDIPEVDDLAETHPSTTQTILSTLEPFKGRIVLDPCCGKNMMANELTKNGHNVICRDLFTLEEHHDFLVEPLPSDVGFIVAHPPFTLKRAFLERCYELGKPFALLVPLLSLGTEAIGELIHKNGCEIRIIVGEQSFYHENEWKSGGYCVWIIGNLASSNNLLHTYIVGHDWETVAPCVRASSFDHTNDLVAEMKAIEKSPEPEKKCSVIDDLPETCSICWDVLNDETYKIGEICAHPLCVYCWVDYTNRGSNSCPVCRQQLIKKRGRGRPRKNR